MSVEFNLEELIQREQHSHCECEVCDCWEDKEQTIKDNLIQKYKKLFKHLDSVRIFCRIIGYRLIEEGNYQLAHQILSAGQTHDISKLTGNEWKYLCDFEKFKGSEELEKAVQEHVSNNSHHPEFWIHGIHEMDLVSLAELVADWFSRGKEFNNPIANFLLEKGFKKYGFSAKDECFKKMNYFYNLLTNGDLLDDLRKSV